MSDAVPARAKTAAKKAPKVTRVKSEKPAPTPKVDEKAKLKEIAEKEKAVKVAKTEAKLEPIAKEITERLRLADLSETKADDHRIAAAIKFADARKMCDDVGIAFKPWAEKHLPNQSYETIRKLVAVGNADDPKLALADMRGKNKEANKNLRKRKKAKPEKNIGADPKSGSGRAESPFQKVEHGLSQMKETEIKELLTSTASEFGMQLVSDKEVKKLKEAAESAGTAATPRKKGDPEWKPLLDGVMALTGKLRADFMFELSEATGYKFVDKATYIRVSAILAQENAEHSAKKGKKAAE
jgi:hypothetical protein